MKVAQEGGQPGASFLAVTALFSGYNFTVWELEGKKLVTLTRRYPSSVTFMGEDRECPNSVSEMTAL